MKNSWMIMNRDIASSHLYYSVQRRKQNHSQNSRLLHCRQFDCIAAVPARLVMTDSCYSNCFYCFMETTGWDCFNAL